MKNILSLVLLATSLISAQAQPARDLGPVEKFNALMFHIQRSYVDEVDADKLVEAAIEALLEELDPHSMYISSEEIREMNEPLEGNFEGIGVQFNIMRDTIVVVSPIAGGPSEKLGILSGDRIVMIEGENVAGVGIKNRDVMRLLKGKKGTQVTVGINRKNISGILDFTITRDKIPIYSVDAHYMATPEVGYIKVNRFAATTMDEFRKALKELNEQGMQDLILDLQGNGGGLLKAAVEMADEFLEGQKMIVYTEGRAYPRRDTKARVNGNFEKGRLVILIDEGSASASEIVSGAVQDWDRGLIIGRRSFGKGLVQRPIELPDSSVVRLTVQRYYTPSGRSIQKPYTEGVKAYKSEKLERFFKGELTSADSINLPDSLKYYTSRNRLVYGGGGIMPDIFVPLDTSAFSDFNTALIRKGVFNQFSLDYTENHRKALLKKFPKVSDFIEGFNMEEDITSSFFAFAEKEGVEFNKEEYDRSKQLIDNRLKALIARNLWNTSAYYQVYNPFWPIYQRAIEVLEGDAYNAVNLADY